MTSHQKSTAPTRLATTRIRRRDIRATFRSGWDIESVTAETLDTRMEATEVHAWLAIARRSLP